MVLFIQAVLIIEGLEENIVFLIKGPQVLCFEFNYHLPGIDLESDTK